MERATVERYETDGHRWAASRKPIRRADAVALGARAVPGTLRIDVGAGDGRYTGDLGSPVVALEPAAAMLASLSTNAPHALRVRGDLEYLPVRRGALGGAWANMTYHHIPRARLPMALADLHRSLSPGAPFDLQVVHGEGEGVSPSWDDIGGRFFASWTAPSLTDVLVGAGFAVEHVEVDDHVVRARSRRAHTLADTVGAGMRLLVCGLNPSVYSAERGVGFARPGNRFWPAVMAAGLVTRPLDPRRALWDHGIGMTDLVKRATTASAELAREEYVAGAARVERLVRWLAPAAVCFVGLEGWRAAIDRRAVAGIQPDGFGGRPAYLLPSTSGLNAHSRLDDLVAHFTAAAALADRS